MPSEVKISEQIQWTKHDPNSLANLFYLIEDAQKLHVGEC